MFDLPHERTMQYSFYVVRLLGRSRRKRLVGLVELEEDCEAPDSGNGLA